MSDFLPLHSLMKVGRPAESVAAWQGGRPVSFSEFTGLTAGWRDFFSSQAGVKWALFFENTLMLATALMGAWQSGKCVYLPSDALPDTVNRLRHEVDGFAGDFPHAAKTVSPAEFSSGDWHACDTDAQSLVLYTSGSTGEPCAIPKKLWQLENEVKTLSQLWDESLGRAPVFATVSHQHIYGLLFRVLWPLSSGRAFAAERLVYPENIWKSLADTRLNLVSSPSHLKRLPPEINWSAVRGNLCSLFSSGGELSEQAWQDCSKLLGRVPIEIYGSSETGGVAWRERNDEADTSWCLMPRVEVNCPQDIMTVKSPHLPTDEWYQTADRARCLSSGFQLLGRCDRLVKIEEKRVSLTAVEERLMETRFFEEVRVITLHDARLRLAVFAIPSSIGWGKYEELGRKGLNAWLREYLRASVVPEALPRQWRYSHEMPLDDRGKVTEFCIRQKFDFRRPHGRLLERTGERVVMELEVDASSVFFKGHFPQHPIFPGVVQVEWAVILGRELLRIEGGFSEIKALKFHRIITPETRVKMELVYQAECHSLQFSFSSKAGEHSAGRILFQGER